VLHDRLSSVFERLEDFVAVQQPKISVEAVQLLQEAAGLSEPERRLIVRRVATLQPADEPAHTGAVLLGIIVGLFAAQFEHE
jgi:hypothetical protein